MMKSSLIMLLVMFASLTQAQNKESLVLDWPIEEHWTVSERISENGQNIFFLTRNGETGANWTELGSMSSIEGIHGVDLEAEMNDLYKIEKKDSHKTKLTFIEKGITGKHPWIIFSIEGKYDAQYKYHESSVWYVIQGDTALYTCFLAMKKEKQDKDRKESWIKFFKAGEMISE